MDEGGVRHSRLIAVAHIQGVDTPEINKGCIRNGILITTIHLQRVDTLEMNKGGIHEFSAIVDCERLYPMNVLEGGIGKCHGGAIEIF